MRLVGQLGILVRYYSIGWTRFRYTIAENRATASSNTCSVRVWEAELWPKLFIFPVQFKYSQIFHIRKGFNNLTRNLIVGSINHKLYQSTQVDWEARVTHIINVTCPQLCVYPRRRQLMHGRYDLSYPTYGDKWGRTKQVQKYLEFICSKQVYLSETRDNTPGGVLDC